MGTNTTLNPSPPPGTHPMTVSAATLSSGLGDLFAPRAARDATVSSTGESFPLAAGVLGSRKVIEAAQRGDRAALGLLLRQLQDPWYRLSLSMLHDADLAAEAVQEAGLRFLRQLSGFR